MIALIGASLALGGAIGMLIGFMAPESGWHRFRGVVGGLVAGVLGASFLIAAFKGRLPAWLEAVFGDLSDIS